MADTEDKDVNECVFDVQNARAFICGEVNDKMHRQFAEFFLRLRAANSSSDVVISFATSGGDVNAALGIYDLIKMQLSPVTILVNGECSSSGTIILQAATHRAATKHSQLLVHYGVETTESTAELKHNRVIERQMADIMVARTGKNIRTIRKWNGGETYFTAAEALAEQLIDEVI